jgi:uncharacterized membrane protein
MTDLAVGRGYAREFPATTSDRTRSVPLTVALPMAMAGVIWTALVGAYAVWRHQQFLSHRYDLGNMVQAVWSTTEGRLLTNTSAETGQEVLRFASHFDPVLVLFAPVWLVYPSPEALLVAQAAFLAFGLYPVVRLALKHTGSELAACLLGLWYLAFPWIVWNALNDFHPIVLTIPLLLLCIWFLDQQHLGRFTACAAVVVLCGELVGVTVAALGVYFAVRSGRRVAGLAIALAGAGWTALCLYVFIPAFNDGRSSQYYALFDEVGGSPGGLAHRLATDPGSILSAATSVADVSYLAWILTPTALLALGQPLLLVVAVPRLSVNLMAESWPTTQPMFQYVAPIVAPLVASTVITVGRFPSRYRPWVAAVPLLAAFYCLLWRPPMPGEQGYLFGAREPSARLAAMESAVELIPPGAPVTATNRLGAHLSVRRWFFNFPMRSRSDWVVVDTRDPWLAGHTVSDHGYDGVRFREEVTQLERDVTWQIVFDSEGVLVFKRIQRGAPESPRPG